MFSVNLLTCLCVTFSLTNSFFSPVNVARKGKVCISHVLKNISKHCAVVSSTVYLTCMREAKIKKEQNATKDEIKAKTVY
jgi:hypothetical protein